MPIPRLKSPLLGSASASLCLGITLMAGLTGCANELPDPAQSAGSRAEAIVGGSRETGWPAVGALFFRHRYEGSESTFCTGFLVAPTWVVTAGHCVTGEGFNPLPAMVSFYIGDDALTNRGSLDPRTGRLVPVAGLYYHPRYDDTSPDHDIGLVRLAEAVTDVTPLALRRMSLGFTDVGTSVTYVGFGVDDGQAVSGEGIKRRIAAPISWVNNFNYRTQYPGAGTCFGDSGGPGIMGSGASMEVVGVNSMHFSDVACQDGYAAKVRIDTEIDWIDEVMALSPDCQRNNDCLCATACTASGACDNSVCQTLTCAQTLDCEAGCSDDVCRTTCALSTRSTDRAQWESLAACRQDHCLRRSTASELLACAQNDCTTLLQACRSGAIDPCVSDPGSCGGADAGAASRADGGSSSSDDGGTLARLDGGVISGSDAALGSADAALGSADAAIGSTTDAGPRAQSPGFGCRVDPRSRSRSWLLFGLIGLSALLLKRRRSRAA